MGYFDALVDGSFKTDDEGVMLFYPNGIMGKGYIIPTIEKKQVIRKRMKILYYVLLPTAIISSGGGLQAIFMLSIPWWVVGVAWLAILVGLAFVSYSTIRRLTTGLIPTSEKLTMLESYKNSAKSNNIIVLWALEIMSLLFVVAGLWMALSSDFAWYFRVNGILSILFGGCGVVVFAFMIKAKIEHQS